MRKQAVIVSAAAAVLLLGGCSKKLGQFKSEYFTTTPTPLEVVGDHVPATITGRIPAKFMLKNVKVTATPVLQWKTGTTIGAQTSYNEVKGAPVLFQGVDVRDNGQIVDYVNGGRVTIPFNVDYKPEMAQSELYLEFNVDQKGKVYALPRVKVGYGVIATATLASPATVYPAIAPDGFQKIITEKYSADIHFLINQANIRSSETGSKEYVDLNQKLKDAAGKPNMQIAGVNISSYASPEGSYDFNERLARQREVNTTNMVESQLKKDKITEFGELTSRFTPEDWEGFQRLVEASNIQDKDLIISVLKMYPDPEQREKEIRNMASVFSELADQILPQLRYSRVQAIINVIGKSDRELVDLFNTDPKRLTADEMLYIATLTDDNMKKMEVYNTAAQIFPQDARSFVNLGATQYVYGDYEGAKANFQHALRLDPKCKQADMNLALISMLNHDYIQANELLGAAAGVPEVNDARGLYYLLNGETEQAVRAFGDAKTNNAALAQILAKDYTAAAATLSGIAKPDATTYYLTAVLGARTANEQMVMSNLRQAIKLDSKLLTRARNDLEFAKYNLSYL